MEDVLFESRKILILDQEGTLDEFVCKVVDQESYYIFHADNLYEFDRLLRSEQPQILIVNIHTRDLDFSTIGSLRHSSATSLRPYVIFAVTRDRAQIQKSTLMQYADDVLEAPFSGYDLLSKIHAAGASSQSMPMMSAMPEVPPIPQKFGREQNPGRKSYRKPKLVSIRTAKMMKSSVQALATPVSLPMMSPQVARKKVSVLSLRIIDFQRLVEELDQGQCVRVVKDLHKLLADTIMRFGGRIAAVNGDTIVAVFSNSTMFPNHRIHALQAAMQIQLSSIFISEQLQFSKIISELTVACALHSTMLTIAELSGDGDQQVSILGSVLPLMFRLLDQAQPGWIVATKECYGEITDHIRIRNEYQLSSPYGAEMLIFARITAADTKSFSFADDVIFKVA